MEEGKLKERESGNENQRDTKEISRQSTLKINYFADGN